MNRYDDFSGGMAGISCGRKVAARAFGRWMRQAHVVLAATVSVCVSGFAEQRNLNGSRHRSPISVQDLNTTHQLIGPLGEPVGKLLTLSLVVNDKNFKVPADSVTVTAVDGRKLGRPTVLNVITSESGTIKTLTPGETMTVQAYEAVMMKAIPYEAMEETAIVQCWDWSNFGTILVIVKSVTASESKPEPVAVINKRKAVDAQTLYSTLQLIGPLGVAVGELATISITADAPFKRRDFSMHGDGSASVKVTAVGERKLDPPATMSATIWAWGNIKKLTPGETMTVRAYQNVESTRIVDPVEIGEKPDQARAPEELKTSLVLVRDVNAPNP